MNFFETGDRCYANRNLPQRGIAQNDQGTVLEAFLIDSEEYLKIELDSGVIVDCSCSNSWNNCQFNLTA